MPPKFLINKAQGTIWPYTHELASNRDLEPYYGDEPTTETAQAGSEVAADSADYDIDPDTGELVKVTPGTALILEGTDESLRDDLASVDEVAALVATPAPAPATALAVKIAPDFATYERESLVQYLTERNLAPHHSTGIPKLIAACQAAYAAENKE